MNQRLRPLAVSSRRRAETLPGVPTMIEAGISWYEVDYWYGLFAPRETASQTIAFLAGI